MSAAADAQGRAYERLERELRDEITGSSRTARAELGNGFVQFPAGARGAAYSIATVQNNQIDGFAQQLVKLIETNAQQLDAVRQSLQQQALQARDEQGTTLKRFGDTLTQQLAQLTEANDRRFAEVRATIEQRLKDIEANNAAKLDEMRKDRRRKLHATLEQRLGESFKLVSDRLEQVHRGLGEMQSWPLGRGSAI